VSVEVAVAELSRRDPVLARLADEHPPPPFGSGRRRWSHFAYLARAVVYQQVSGRSAEPIWRRVQDLVDGPFSARAAAALSTEQLRSAGLTGGKARAISELASAVASGQLPLATLARRPDDEVVAALTAVWGIGRWTAEMFLLLHLGRLDVWPVGDLAVRRGFARSWALPSEPTPVALDALGERFRPYRSVVAWYCWRAHAPAAV
jgi:DNA-3-methyladenine glycosylase II